MGEVRRTPLFDAYGRLVAEATPVAQSLTGPKGRQYFEVSLRTLTPGVRSRRKVHHLILEAFVGPRPEGLKACHNNGDGHDNRLDNLRWDTQANNIADMHRHRGGHHNALKTHCLRGHPLTPDNVYANGQGRKCKTCARDRAAAQYAAKKAR
jgi:hypothetical protein